MSPAGRRAGGPRPILLSIVLAAAVLPPVLLPPTVAAAQEPTAAASDSAAAAPEAATPETEPAAREPRELDPAILGGLRIRPIGPAVMSGRIAAIDGVPADPPVLYVGSAGGGVWKSADGGTTFEPVFDDHAQSIGAVAVDPSHPDTVWVGTGESWTRNSVSAGTGVYRSPDGGETWEARGLEASERIARIQVHPEDGATVYVCATGRLWSSGGERGVYRTTDGGESWERVLHVDEDTGCSDLAMDPRAPNVLYAGMWQVRRWPWFFASGGPGSGLYRSLDGGDTWEELTEGLPEGEKGRVAVAVAPSRPATVYALVEAEETALYRSDDMGEAWTRLSTSDNVQSRPFYFALLRVDPRDHRKVYKPGFTLTVSEDGGESFSSFMTGGGCGASPHSDHHALWIDPRNPQHLVLGTDGGVYISEDGCSHWRHVRSLPVSQFYEVAVDSAWPYQVYGGLQDNGSWMGPSRATGGIQNRDWTNIGYGDGFDAFPDPEDPDIVFVQYQGGQLLRYRRSTGEIKQIKPYAEAGGAELRFNWNTPVHASPVDPGTIYAGAQFLLRSRDRGETWERISPDLTTDDPEKQRQEESGGLTIDNSTAENHTTIYTISESPREAGVIWVGTDDGNLQVTRDGGESWTNVVGNVPNLPAGTWVSHVEASPHRAGTALATFDGHRTGDMTPYVYRTEDYGASWRPLADESLEGWAHVVKQDPENPDLLFLGTELGLWVSVDGGEGWARYEEDFPPVAVRDLEIHPREGDLVVATHGRGIWILDDLTPLRSLTPEVLASDAALLPSRPAVQVLSASLQQFPGDDEFVGRNPGDAAHIVYYLARRHIFGDLRVEVYDAEGERVSTLPGGKRRGLNRVEWPMRLEPPKVPPATTLTPAMTGPRVPEGTYTVRLVKGDSTYEGTVTLAPDPRSPHSAEDRALQRRTARRLYDLLERLAYAVDAAIELRDAARERADAEGIGGGLADRLRAYADALEAWREELVATGEGGQLSGEERLRERLGEVYAAVNGYDGRPTGSQLDRTRALETEVEAAEETFGDLVGEGLDRLNAELAEEGIPLLEVPSREEWAER